MTIEKTAIEDLVIINPTVFEDSRGYFFEAYNQAKFQENGISYKFIQDNQSFSKRGVVRGLHLQINPFAQAKLVRVLEGEILDVAVDLRKNSPTFLQWYGEVLSEHNQRSLLIPEGFAHGFQTLTEDCELIYLHSAPYIKEAEAALNAIDPKLGIAWPLPITEISEKDRLHPMIKLDFEGIVV